MSYYRRDKNGNSFERNCNWSWGGKQVFTPSIETFIRHWQESKSAIDCQKRLNETLGKLRVESDKDDAITVADASALASRASNWRRKGIPLRELAFDHRAETREEYLHRLRSLAMEHGKEQECQQ